MQFHFYLSFQTAEVSGYSWFQSQVKGICNESMSYRNLFKVRNVFEEVMQVFKAKIMAGIYFKAHSAGNLCRPDIRLNSSITPQRVEPCIGFGVQFDTVGAGFGGSFNHLLIRINKNGCSDAMSL